jgi:hypothetical protein
MRSDFDPQGVGFHINRKSHPDIFHLLFAIRLRLEATERSERIDLAANVALERTHDVVLVLYFLIHGCHFAACPGARCGGAIPWLGLRDCPVMEFVSPM